MSQLKWERVGDIRDEVHVGDVIRVKVISIDEGGKLKVSAKECMPKPEGYTEPKKPLRPQHGAKGDRYEKRAPREGANVEKRVFRRKEESAE